MTSTSALSTIPKELADDSLTSNKKKYKTLPSIYAQKQAKTKDIDNTIFAPEQELKSISGRKCLTKCYEKGKIFFHPISLVPTQSLYNGACATNPYYVDDDGILGGLREYDKCRLEDNELSNPPDESAIILLSFTFDAKYFLNNFYGLKSFDQVIQWTLENDNLPYLTIYRIHNCAWKVYGKNIDALTFKVLEYYYEKSKNDWLVYYTKILQSEYSFDIIKKENNNQSSNFNQMYQLLLNNFYTYNFFVTSVKKYVYENQNIWDKIQSHYDRLKIYILNCLIKKLDDAEKIQTK